MPNAHFYVGDLCFPLGFGDKKELITGRKLSA